MMRVKSVERYEEANQTVPEEVMVTFDFGRPESVPTASTCFTTSIPSTTSPKTTCLPSSHDVTTVVMKNCAACQLLRAHPHEAWEAEAEAHLRAVRVRSCVRHREQARLVMPTGEVLVCVGGINAFTEGHVVSKTDLQTSRRR